MNRTINAAVDLSDILQLSFCCNSLESFLEYTPNHNRYSPATSTETFLRELNSGETIITLKSVTLPSLSTQGTNGVLAFQWSMPLKKSTDDSTQPEIRVIVDKIEALEVM